MSIREIAQKNIKRIRVAKKLSQDDLFEITNLPKSTLSKIENQPMNLTLDTLERIARGLDCEVYQLLYTKPQKNEKSKSQRLREAISLIRQVLADETKNSD